MTEEQCQQCHTRETCIEIRNYDGTGCPNFRQAEVQNTMNDEVSESDFDDLSLHHDPEEQEKEERITRERLKATTNIHGWLVFFFVAILLGATISVIYNIATFNSPDYAGIEILAWGDVLSSLSLLAVAILTVVAFVRRSPDAVFLGKMYIVAVFALNLFTLLVGDFEESGFGSVGQLVRSLVWGVIWFCYLTFSKQVKEVIPKEYRRRTKWDYLLLALVIAIPVITFSAGVSMVLNQSDDEDQALLEEEQRMLNMDLEEDERTDGIVIFRVPEGFESEEDVRDHGIYYHLNKDSNYYVFVFGDYQVADKTIREVFDTVLVVHNDDEMDELFPFTIVDDGKSSSNGVPYYYNVKKWKLDDDMYYYQRVFLLWDNETSKICCVLGNDFGDDSYLEEILPSIRFQ